MQLKKYEHTRVRVFLRSRKNAQKIIFIFRLQNADFQSVGRGYANEYAPERYGGTTYV